MRKEKFYYNTQTLRYEKISLPIKTKLLRGFGFLSAVVFTTLIGMSLLNNFYPSANEEALMREINQMKNQYVLLEDQLGVMNKVLGNVQERDAGVHRMMFGMNPIDEDVWNAGIGGHEEYAYLTDFKHSGELLKHIQSKADKLSGQLAIQSKSLDKIEELAKDREKELASMPLIMPVRRDKLKKDFSLLSGFGMRLHPVYRRMRMHTGIDFTAPSGTPIQATGAGKIVKVKHDKGSYGKHVVIDHGYGYKTLYAHMQSIDVKEGQMIVRGEQIGKVGNTGRSTGPHLHYEVRYNDRPVDPVDYCIDNLNKEEYQSLIDAAATANQSLDSW